MMSKTATTTTAKTTAATTTMSPRRSGHEEIAAVEDRTGLVIQSAVPTPIVLVEALPYQEWSRLVRSAMELFRHGRRAINGYHILGVELRYREGLCGIHREARIHYANGQTVELTATNGSPADKRYAGAEQAERVTGAPQRTTGA